MTEDSSFRGSGMVLIGIGVFEILATSSLDTFILSPQEVSLISPFHFVLLYYIYVMEYHASLI